MSLDIDGGIRRDSPAADGESWGEDPDEIEDEALDLIASGDYASAESLLRRSMEQGVEGLEVIMGNVLSDGPQRGS